MSGHSKWSTIKHKKAIEDQKKGKIFSKLSRAISVAVSEGESSDPENNPQLRMLVEKAREVNMPKENIKKAIEKGQGKGGESWQSFTFEGFGPEKIALMIECVSDNKNRTTASIKSFLERNGGVLGSPGSTAYLFDKKGLILVTKRKNSQEQMLSLIDLGIEEIEEERELIEVYVPLSLLEEVKKKIKEAGFEIALAELTEKPKTLIRIPVEKTEKVIHFLDELGDQEDVQKVYCNADLIIK